MVLRKLGVDVKLHIGLYNVLAGSENVRTKGHCWLTLDGVVLCEPEAPGKEYQQMIAETDSGICYWLGKNVDTVPKIEK